MILKMLALLTLSLTQADGSESFEFYLGELVTNRLDAKHGMIPLIERGIIESIFESHEKVVFLQRLNDLQIALQKHPELYQNFVQIDRGMAREFEERLAKAKRKRLYYSAGGVLVGALVGIPIGKAFGGGKALWISIPASALAGGGAGFLLGDLLAMPKYEFLRGQLVEDLEFELEQLEDF